MVSKSVSIILPSLATGGAENVLVQLANGLRSAGWTVEIVTLEMKGDLIERVNPNVKIVDLGCSSYRGAVLALARHYVTSRPCTVLTSMYATGIAAIAAKMISSYKPKVIVGAHNSLRAKLAHPDNIKDKYLLAPLCKLLLPSADAYIAVSRGVAEELESVLSLDGTKMHVVYNPLIDRALISRAAEPTTHPWLVNQTARKFKPIVSVGRLVEQKGLDVLIEAFAKARGIIDCRLIIVGAGPLLSILEDCAESHGVRPFVDFVGLQRNPQKFVSRADLFVLSSRWEGLPSVLVEALACGCPVVATDCKFGPREILEGGKYGRLVPVDDPVVLAAAIVDELKSVDLNAKSAAALRTRSLEFSVERSVAQYDRIFNDVARSPGSGETSQT